MSGAPKETRKVVNDRRAAAQAMRHQQVAKDRRRRTLMAGGGVVAVLIVIGVLVGVGLNQSKTNTSGPATTFNGSFPAATADVVNAVGAGGSAVILRPSKISAPALTENGKPKIVFVGAEWCPYCAAQRWVIADALSRFGTFKNLSQTQSSSTDVYPGTRTLSFHGSTYTSDYIAFTGAEIQNQQQQPFDKLSAADQAIYQTYDSKAYTGSDGGFPFMDLGGTYLLPGAMFDPGVLQGLTQDQILVDLKDPSSPVAKAIVGSANALTATICTLTANNPATVCDASGVHAAAS